MAVEPERPRYVLPGTPRPRGRGRPKKPPPWMAAQATVLGALLTGGALPTVGPPHDETGPTVLFGPYARALANIPAAEPVAVAWHATRSYYVEVVGASVASPFVA